MNIFCIRGATTIKKNDKQEILKETENLMQQIILKNNLDTKNIISILFTSTKDITKAYPALAVRKMGINNVSLMCMQEMDVENSLEMCIRVMITIQGGYNIDNIKHIYLNEAKKLRLDLIEGGFTVAIDGPAGSGKSTISKEIAKEIGFKYIDTGAMYRSVAYYFIKKNINFNQIVNIKQEIENINLETKFINQNQHMLLNSEDITSKIRTSEISKKASEVAKISEVREKLIEIQRNLAQNEKIIIDGRDIGTNVLPNANVKIYLDADIEERAKRRFKELIKEDKNISLEQIKEDIIKRDFEDKNREIAPLKQALDSILINTSNLSIEEVKIKIIEIIKEKIE